MIPGFDLISFLKATGYLGLFGVVFAESGLFIGFFLPGDSLLFTAGFLASQGYFNIALLMLVCLLGAILGDSFGYAFGKKTGETLFAKEDSFFFHKRQLERARIFYELHGKKTIILARFMPIIRTFAPILAGVGQMRYPTFLSYNVIGGIAWGVGIPAIGYFLGSVIPNIDKYLLPIVLGIIVVSVLPPAIHVLKDKEYRDETIKIVKKYIGLA
ncbi:MAG: hypothetical protein A3A28_02310 [Candidatus Sungbacteria bacterium RIFCSPLOWO2_01_FULL_47_32]|uniref:VTT domain-containing protein n=1 Tax=Candidatus Sungbacteria bacterium RIFCSPHIGHO2_01_FULL_47_32 TaxID=1802264 RepID=A0A1G2K7E6_9BACT|nr:MAG: hypothetical protein UX72_C0033G0008 [Parcubacteria group bacterium GW2011_GWA2_47_10]OGZ94348.1 MAG: hypothetical protein A2633_01950 [Candidatus Sungbacteria bacterium RIFCSPHIGHO2_01_FULL_47_32]OHA04922.1 MAG: hypothetical protein A3A28_02310 [Candidatus Sungbacteria bacterium RIFCSPLOWO2_01_FULL_47_32]